MEAPERERQLLALDREVENLANAVAAGTFSRTLRAKLEAAEAEREDLLKAAPNGAQVVQLVTDTIALYQRLVAELPKTLARDPVAARGILMRLLGEIPLEERNGHVFAVLRLPAPALLR